MLPENALEIIEAYAREKLADTPACHDWDHTLRVRRNALALLDMMRENNAAVEPVVLEAAALLHDIGRLQELKDMGRSDHAAISAELLLRDLPKRGISDKMFLDRVAECVRSHRYRGRTGSPRPASIEAKILYDADKLDSIGAVGIGRAFHFAGNTGARVHNSAQEALNSSSYSKEDSAYREYLVKLRHIHEKMLTAQGKALAEQRHQFMVSFFQQLNEETGYTDL